MGNEFELNKFTHYCSLLHSLLCSNERYDAIRHDTIELRRIRSGVHSGRQEGGGVHRAKNMNAHMQVRHCHILQRESCLVSFISALIVLDKGTVEMVGWFESEVICFCLEMICFRVEMLCFWSEISCFYLKWYVSNRK